MGNVKNSFPVSQHSIMIVQREYENKKLWGEEKQAFMGNLDEIIEPPLYFPWIHGIAIEFIFIFRDNGIL